MGITGLLPLLKPILKPVHLEKYRGSVIGIDAYVWLHKSVLGSAYDLGLGKPNVQYVLNCQTWLDLFTFYGITPYLVFDGRNLPAKAPTEILRSNNRILNLTQAKKNHKLGNFKEAEEGFRKGVNVTHELAFELIKVLKKRKLPYIVAPYEADAQLAFLSRTNMVDLVCSEDSDLIVFQCPKILYKLEITGHCLEFQYSDLSKIPELGLQIGKDPIKFRHMCILSGCDYLPSIPKIGLKTALKFVLNSSTYLQAINRIKLTNKFKVPQNYEKEFFKADLTFKYQTICDPKNKIFRPLCEPPTSLPLNLVKFLGEITQEEDIVIGLGNGDLHPDTRNLMESEISFKVNEGLKDLIKNRPIIHSNIDNSISINGIKRCAPDDEIITLKPPKSMLKSKYFKPIEPVISNLDDLMTKFTPEPILTIQSTKLSQLKSSFLLKKSNIPNVQLTNANHHFKPKNSTTLSNSSNSKVESKPNSSNLKPPQV